MQIRLQVFYLILSSIEIAQSAYVKYDDVINNKKGTVFWKSQKMSNFNKISIFQKSQFFENLIFSKISFCFQKYQQSNIFIKISFFQKKKTLIFSQSLIFSEVSFFQKSHFFKKYHFFKKSHFLKNLTFSNFLLVKMKMTLMTTSTSLKMALTRMWWNWDEINQQQWFCWVSSVPFSI